MAMRDAFNLHAPVYDSRFTHSPAGQAMRQCVWTAVEKILVPDSRMLDLGCGTGEDAIHFATRGSAVTAIDIAPDMVAALIAKARAAGLSARIDARVSDLESLSPLPDCVDAIFSNFGAINCVGELDGLRRLSSQTLRPGGHLILVSMGRLYPLETLVFLAKGDMRAAFRRLGKTRLAAVEGQRFPVWYYSPRHLQQALGVHFSLVELQGICALLPVPGFEHLGRYLPLKVVKVLDAALTRNRFTAALADHYLSIWRYDPV
jgi:SAM-dependent methyltransferase